MDEQLCGGPVDAVAMTSRTGTTILIRGVVPLTRSVVVGQYPHLSPYVCGARFCIF